MSKKAERYLEIHPWKIEEIGLHRDKNQVSESIFSIGNEYTGIRGYAEEGATLPSLQGSYFNGIYEWHERENTTAYKGIIRRGHYMVNAVNWVKTDLYLDGVRVDPAAENVSDFCRSLDFRTGVYERSYTVHTQKGAVRITFTRFLAMRSFQNAYQKIRLSADAPVEAELCLSLSFAEKHWGRESRWQKTGTFRTQGGVGIEAKTASTGQYVRSTQRVHIEGVLPEPSVCVYETELSVGQKFRFTLCGTAEIRKHVLLQTDKTCRTEPPIWQEADFSLQYGLAEEENRRYWEEFWQNTDIRIEGDDEGQQGIRFCMFQLQQTYHGASPTDNVGAKGLTGEAYSGHAFWDTETYCLPFYLFNNPTAAKDLLLYRYHTLPQAKERAKMLDCQGACYPIATLNGYEACDLWQHASLQFQPSTAVAYGIAHYVNVTGDTQFLSDYGLEMLVEISRFLRSRGDFNADGSKFGYYCVMGPDEFQMMVNHNAYTNFMAKKTFLYTLDALQRFPDSAAIQKTGVTQKEKEAFWECAQKMYIPYDAERKLFEQHEGFFDLPHVDVKKIPLSDFPLYYHWSYDRIYRNDMIKQPDVLMFMLLYNGDFSLEQKKANYEYYEPRCIHESSLSPSVHSILASELGKDEEALRFFGFASRLDLDDYNRNTNEGLHTTGIAAAWLNIVYGFGGLRSDGKKLILRPRIPAIWQSYAFRFRYRGSTVTVTVRQDKLRIEVLGAPFEAQIYGEDRTLSAVTEIPL